MEAYAFREVEKKWQRHWHESQVFKTKNLEGRPKAYILEMFPYPSGKLHMGHVRNYSIGDAIARYKMALGYNVLHPMGWDSFGLPAENAAVQNKTCPDKWTDENIAAMKQQLNALGFSYDWDCEVTTCKPSYYGFEQKIFLDFYKKGLATRKESWVNWDPVDQSVLANEQVINGRGWRSGAPVEKRKLIQWSLQITKYAEELLQDLSALTGWPEKVIRMQENWIGKSEGAFLSFSIVDRQDHLDVFTTRPETLFGASFCAIAPVHPLAEEMAQSSPSLRKFIEDCQQTPTTEEAISTAEKKGFDTGLRVRHPFIKNHTLPVYVANFVLMDYGTGAIFACPAHDERDHEFATKYGLPIIQVINSEDGSHDFNTAAYTGSGSLINSDFLNGMDVPTARSEAIAHLESLGVGRRQITYRLRDWCISRQRYWGCPIPIIYCESCGTVPVPESDLPVVLPTDISFDKPGNPLDYHPTWKHVSCPSCGKAAVRETDTFDTFFESSWYFLRYCNPNFTSPIDPQACQEWMPVDWYVGGIEHAVLHLLYARFFTKALRDCGYISLNEPFKNLLTQGMVCHETYQDSQGKWLYPDEIKKSDTGEWVAVETGLPVTVGRSEKMSKSKKNLVDPQEIIDSYGADAARLFILSDTPPDRDFEWSEEGVEGAWRYINRLWRLYHDISSLTSREGTIEATLKIRKSIHQSIVKVEGAFEKNAFNKVIAFLRELTRTLEEGVQSDNISSNSLKEGLRVLITCFSPIIPHLACELISKMTDGESSTALIWPKADPTLAAVDEVTIAVQVNGKLRGSFNSFKDIDKESLEAAALALPGVIRDIGEKPIKRVVIIPNKIVNIVV
jgi:leucyl-tRNA synthetase